MFCIVSGWGLWVCSYRYYRATSTISDTDMKSAAAHTTSVSIDEDYILTPQDNRGGWVNPEDLTPMPQCVAQQDQSSWLNAMTRCTSRICTRHFGIICTHHQYLTQLSCLSTAFSPDVVRGYLKYCSRSVLAEAQLYSWIHQITGRTWLVGGGDANRLRYLSPRSLTKGYAEVGVTYKAPMCLTGSVSARTRESFRQVMASCSFTSTTQHTGNAARPWEYSESSRSMTALDSETASYDLVWGSIRYGDYFDKACLCTAFAIDPENEPCVWAGKLDLTKERLWIDATCGPASLPDGWNHSLQTTDFAYIPIEDWHWPKCVASMPREVTHLTDQCVTDACERDSSGYCKVKRAIDRACFCRKITYDSCGGACHVFDNRIDYAHWLHNLCGNVKNWSGLPDNWRQLAVPSSLELIPWQWSIKPSSASNSTSSPLGPNEPTETCPSSDWKVGSLALINVATFVAIVFGPRADIHQHASRVIRQQLPSSWVFKGLIIAAIQLLANWFNAFIVQTTFGYEDVPIIQLILLWCSIPRRTWFTIALIGGQPVETIDFSSAASSLLAECILQAFSSYYMIMTVSYGLEHSFYFGGMTEAERESSATMMYAGALLWLTMLCVAFVQFVPILRTACLVIESDDSSLLKRQKKTTSTIAEEIEAQLDERSKLLGENLKRHWNRGVYGTMSDTAENETVSPEAYVGPYLVIVFIMLFLWIAQWLFWSGFIGLSVEEYVHMHMSDPC
jgi:hypothetical protein